MGRSARHAAVACLAVLAVGLSGCDTLNEFVYRSGGGNATRRAVEHPDAISPILAFFGYETRQEGTNTPTGPGTTEIMNKLVTGPFKGTLPFRIAVPAMRARGTVVTNKLKGNFAAQFNGSTDANAGTGSLSGIGVLSFRLKALGTACFQMSAGFTQHGTKGTGTFKSTGGTGGAATMRVTGTFKDTITPISSTTAKDSGKIHAHAKLHKPPKAAPAACKALAAKLPG